MSREKRTYLDRSKAIPGLRQAFRLTMIAATITSAEEDGGRDEEKFYDLKLKITRKVAELWELSPMMEQYLIQRWVEGKAKLKVELEDEDNYFRWAGVFSDRQKTTGHDLELEMLFTGKEVSELHDINSKLETLEARVITENQIRKERLYLDVTGLSYKDLRNAYKAVVECQKMIGIESKDVRRGAPQSMDFTRALIVARLEERGLSRREIAEIMEFKIYTQDIRSGTYPLLQKYLKVGREILARINKLEEYINELTGIAPGSL